MCLPARGGVVHFGQQGVSVRSFTDALCAGTLNFVLNVGGFQLTAGLVTSVTSNLAARASLGFTRFDVVQPTRVPIQPVSSPSTPGSTLARSRALADLLFESASVVARVQSIPSFGGGSSVPQNWFAPLQGILDEIFSNWNGLERDLLSEPKSNDGESDDAKPEFIPVGRIWDAMMEAVEGMFQSDSEAAQSDEDQQAASADNARSDDGGNEGQTSQDSEDAADQAASSQTSDRRQTGNAQPINGPISQASDVSPVPQAPVVETTSQVEDQPHATAA